MAEPERRVVLMRHDVQADPCDAALEDGDARYVFEGVAGDALRAIAQRCDGKNDIPTIARALEMSPAVTEAVCDAFVSLRLGVELSAESETPVAPAEFCRMARSLIPGWKRRLFEHRLWTSLSDGSAPFAVFRSWLLESYHFIEGVNVRLPVAIAFAENRAVQSLFAHHFAEEYDHAEFFLRALESFGIERPTVKAASPLPSTRAILMHMRACGRRDPLQYAVCSGFLESTGEDRVAGRTFFERLTEHYAESPAAIAPLRAHLDLDERYGHNAMLEGLCDAIGPIGVKRASAALDAALTLVETLELWSSDIERSADPLHVAPIVYRRRLGRLALGNVPA